MKKGIFWVCMIMLIPVVPVAGGEAAIRAYHMLKYGRNHAAASAGAIALDDHLGWEAARCFHFSGIKKDAAGKEYAVSVSTNADGFRVFGNAKRRDRLKILFIGDSFTHAIEVSDAQTYYALLGTAVPAEVFAYGGRGFGTLQEYMILDRFVDAVRPDLVILQLCSNDFINNHYGLEIRSTANNNGMRRPYLAQDGSVVYALPRALPAVREACLKYSRFLTFVLGMLDKVSGSRSGSVEEKIGHDPETDSLFAESVQTTGRLFAMIRRRVPAAVPIVAFSADDFTPYYEAFKAIAARNDMQFAGEVPQALREAERRGETIRAADGAHWNERGHAIAAAALSGRIKKVAASVVADPGTAAR